MPFKKIFKPIRKVLDKVIPNEIKPFLPYAAAAVPFLAPTAGIFGTMAGRAALSGGANLLSQLAQEGTTEDDLNLMSTGIAALSGALTAGRPDQFVGPAEKGFMIEGSPSAADFFKTKAAGMDEGILKSATNLLGTGASKVQGMGEVLRTDPFSKAGATASILPLSQGTGDAMYAESVRLNKQQIIDDALAGLEEGATDAMRGDAIRLAMLQYGFSDDEIAETIASAGYKDGGITGLQIEMIEGKKDGGLMNLGGKEMDLRGGGFVPIGKKERADDVPARLSKNEFVMTADAVRAAGGGSVNKGAKRMYDLMNNLEARV